MKSKKSCIFATALAIFYLLDYLFMWIGSFLWGGGGLGFFESETTDDCVGLVGVHEGFHSIDEIMDEDREKRARAEQLKFIRESRTPVINEKYEPHFIKRSKDEFPLNANSFY